MPLVSRPIAGLVLVGVIAIAVLLATNDSTPTATKAAPVRKAVAKAGEPDWDLPVPDPTLRFGKTPPAPRNVFAPLVVEAKPVVLPREIAGADDLVAVPAGLAGGEGGWVYTGMVEANGVRMALLENKGTKQSGYVREGDFWKKAHVVGISSPCVVFADEKGANLTVFRFDPNAPPKAKPEAGPSFGPGGVGAPLVGPIAPGGSGLAVRPILPSASRTSR